VVRNYAVISYHVIVIGPIDGSRGGMSDPLKGPRCTRPGLCFYTQGRPEATTPRPANAIILLFMFEGERPSAIRATNYSVRHKARIQLVLLW